MKGSEKLADDVGEAARAELNGVLGEMFGFIGMLIMVTLLLLVVHFPVMQGDGWSMTSLGYANATQNELREKGLVIPIWRDRDFFLPFFIIYYLIKNEVFISVERPS